MDKVRINLANPQELLEIPGLDRSGVDAIVRHRSAHGPIRNADELARVLGSRRLGSEALARLDFDPALATAPEAPGA